MDFMITKFTLFIGGQLTSRPPTDTPSNTFSNKWAFTYWKLKFSTSIF